eukprot:17832_1
MIATLQIRFSQQLIISTEIMTSCYSDQISGNVITYSLVITTIVGCIVLIAMLYCIIKYIIYYCGKKTDTQSTKISKLLHIIGLIYFIISFICVILLIARNVTYLCNKQVMWWSQSLNYMQSYLIWVILFLRLYDVFKDSFEHALSLKTIVFYIILLFLQFVLIVLALIYSYVEYIVHVTSSIVIECMSLVISTSLLALFLYKLISVYNTLNISQGSSCNITNNIWKVIVKNTVLASITILSNIIHGSCYLFCVHWWENYHIQPFWVLCQSVIELTWVTLNFICIALTYSFLKTEYRYLCGWMHNLCECMLSKCCTSTHNTIVDEESEEYKIIPLTSREVTFDQECV